MNAKLRMCAASAAALAVLAACGSQAPVSAVHSTPTRPACPPGSPYPPGTYSAVDYIDAIQHDSVNYNYFPSVRITASQVGDVVTRIQCTMSTYPGTQAPPDHWANDTATFLTAGTPVHAVKGFSPQCRLAAYVSGHPRAYVAVKQTKRGPVPWACAKAN
jgi:hypothetical protein